ncbi:MAG: transporter substrate-binding protein [Solirubrobacterales bacterium]|nr:transporter substrate-binding protein [Solirubrobacterales bacterium]
MRRALALVLAALAPVAAGCSGGKSASTRITSDTLTIYSGLPLRGEDQARGRAVLRGEKLALDEVGGRVGSLDIGLVALDDTKTSTGRWDPRQVAANARQAAENPSTIAYIGDLDSGASAVSVPIVNEIGILQVSPLSGYTGLTDAADKGEPDKYYPSGARTFVRLVPAGAVEARDLGRWIRDLGYARVTLATDGLQEGLGHGTELERALRAQQITVADIVRVDPTDGPADDTPDVAGAARDIAQADAPALVYAGASIRTAIALLRAVHDRSPSRALFATSGVAGPRLAAALPNADELHMLSPLLPLAERPAAARRMAARYRQTFGSAPPPAALYGYEAMRSVLDAIRRAGKDGNDRRAVLAAYLGRTVGESVLGAYSVGADGDVSPAAIGAFGVRAGHPRLERVMAAPVG